VAHLRIERPENHLPTFQELDDCIDAIAKLLVKYWKLCRIIDYTQSGMLSLWQCDCKAIFKEAWIPRDS
jgi:hypothetical protein